MLWRVEEHEPLTEREWDPVVAGKAIGAIVADAEAAAGDGGWPGHPLDDVPADSRLAPASLRDLTDAGVKRVAFGFTNFENFRIRALLYAGKPNVRVLDSIVVT